VLRTQLCGVLDIDVPLVQASLGPWAGVEVAASVSNAGGLGTVGPAPEEVEAMRARTALPFAIDLATMPPSDEELARALEAQPRAVWLCPGGPDRVSRAHEAGCLVVQQVRSAAQARQAAEAGADVVVAHGGEAGAFVLVAQIVDAVRPIPVVAAGGMTDGRSVAAALMLGAHGACIDGHVLGAAANRNGQTAGFVRGVVGDLMETAEDCLRRGLIAVG
jgi:nitronate monooxygenase/enoyl-[acyl-carrier protein] reductase II